MLEKVYFRLNHRLSPNNPAKASLGGEKSANGMLALKWWRKKRLDKIIKYCTEHVRITKELYLYELERGFLLFANKVGSKVRVPVDFTGPS